jgi:peptide/nickel transport system permease protein
VVRLDFGAMPAGAGQPVAAAVAAAALYSLALLGLTFLASVALGLALGLGAVRTQPAGLARWLAPLATVGLALPSFYVGTLFIVAAVAYVLRAGPEAEFPLPLGGPGAGGGLALALVAPVAALAVRPTAQIARVTARMLAGELQQPYVAAARAFGHTWRRIRWRQALRNALPVVVLTVAGSFRLLLGELILAEWLFNWPGLGRLLALALVPPRAFTPGGSADHTLYFLHPPLLAALLTAFTLLFLLADMLAAALARAADPRLRDP